MTIMAKYLEALKCFPAPGSGGCHTHLLSVANLGILAGLSEADIFSDIRRSIPSGSRKVPDSEILKTIDKAKRTATGIPSNSPPVARPCRATHIEQPKDGSAYRRELISRSRGVSEADLWELSPIRLAWQPGPLDAVAILDTFYRPEEFLFIGTAFDKSVLPAAEWIKRIQELGAVPWPHIAPNPFSGQPHTSKDGKQSYRCDAAVSSFRFVTVEFDNMPQEDQLAFWHSVIDGALMPVAALIDSGGKSIHAWIRVDLATAQEWTTHIEQDLFPNILIPIGADGACKNEARLSRLPGHIRDGKLQRLLYLAG